MGYLIISCINPEMVAYAEEVQFGFDTLVITILIGVFIYLSKAYENPKGNQLSEYKTVDEYLHKRIRFTLM